MRNDTNEIRPEALVQRLQRLLGQHARELLARRHSLREELTPEARGLREETESSVARETRGLGVALVGLSARTVQDIESALRRLHTGTYGLCTDCGAAIRAARLRALPFAEACLDCQALRDEVTPLPVAS